MPKFTLPAYVENLATIKISGSTVPQKAGRCAFHILNRGTSPEFLCIGANANHQCMKSIACFMYFVEQEMPGHSVAFQPKRFSVKLTDKESQKVFEYDACVWQTVILGPNNENKRSIS